VSSAVTSHPHLRLDTSVLIIGAGAAGMAAAIAAHDAGEPVMLVDRSLIGRGGATVMAQMTVAAAIGDEVPDNWQSHLSDTLTAGRGLCDLRLAQMLCEDGPAAIRQMDTWHVGWARHHDGRLRQTHAPGHERPRCVYVDFLNTGPAVSKTLRAQVQRRAAITRIGELCITELVVNDGAITGAVGFSLADGSAVAISAKAVIIAAGGLTRLYARNSASANMGGDGYALALRAGAELIDMEFVQFFPIGHLAPRLVGMDPIMWDPFRYKLGGRLLNCDGREFIDAYGIAEDGRYVAPRDIATYAILKEVKARRGSPHGGVFLSFQHVEPEKLREAFGPVVDRLAANGIDLARMPVEVAPIAHYHMGGIHVDANFSTCVSGLFAAGEAVGGANGANRLSGNAITEALVFGGRAGAAAVDHARRARSGSHHRVAIPSVTQASGECDANPAALIAQLQSLMSEHVGPFRTEAGLAHALKEIACMKESLGAMPPAPLGAFDSVRLDWFDARTMLLVGEAVARAALSRRESRGAHQREDYPATDAEPAHQVLHLRDAGLQLRCTRESSTAEAAQ
jgi:succinate dehydrogenase / fumarate reductase flavoprotein subunit/fumarate reductase (CoM/CoB) subunit A